MIREPSQPLKRCPKWVCVEDAVKIVNSGIYTYIYCDIIVYFSKLIFENPFFVYIFFYTEFLLLYTLI